MIELNNVDELIVWRDEIATAEEKEQFESVWSLTDIEDDTELATEFDWLDSTEQTLDPYSTGVTYTDLSSEEQQVYKTEPSLTTAAESDFEEGMKVKITNISALSPITDLYDLETGDELTVVQHVDGIGEYGPLLTTVENEDEDPGLLFQIKDEETLEEYRDQVTYPKNVGDKILFIYTASFEGWILTSEESEEGSENRIEQYVNKLSTVIAAAVAGIGAYITGAGTKAILVAIALGAILGGVFQFTELGGEVNFMEKMLIIGVGSALIGGVSEFIVAAV